MKNITKKLAVLLVASAFVLSGCEQTDSAVTSKPETKTQQSGNSVVTTGNTNTADKASSSNSDQAAKPTSQVNNQAPTKSNTETKASTTAPASTPAPVQKENVSFSVSVSDSTPSKNERITINVSGPGGTFVGQCNYKSKNTPISGNVGAPIKVDISRATAGYTVNVDITITYKGNTYNAETSFTPK
ncbi:hypothetical protein IAI10_01445 [Clostridium sp. 19966]|uniref:hypothetical protein n=1 Tax=Clostridium sp. 19966 TaxID=2768166 RepID=UPI0028DDFA51|nr:hypothetical protein [Clostridium sp. 19966]MDT8715340.1 hypothetical protein [Clostridium sp. 19966]